MALKIEDGRVVMLAYRLLDGDGRLLEERTPESPYEYMQGQGQILTAVEKAVSGKTTGFRATLELEPDRGYGHYDPDLVAEIPRARFPKTAKLESGMKFNTVGPDNEPLTVRVIDIDEIQVTVDGNHPLAGLDLVFELRILDVREPTVEEGNAGRAMPPPLKPGSESIH